MKLLLDTHVWIWFLTGEKKLKNKVVQLLTDDKNEVFLSPISLWEAFLLGSKKRVVMNPDPQSWIQDALSNYETLDLPLSREIILKSKTLELKHRDPADLFLACTAHFHQIPLVTADNKLLELDWLKTISAA